MEVGLVLAAALIGLVVGLTGMGGGALMTPLLVLFFGVPPLTAVSSDLIASAVMKPFGSFVHARHGTVQWPIVLWLVVGSVPAAFSGALLLQLLGPIPNLPQIVKLALGIALLIAAGALITKAYIALVARTRPKQSVHALSLSDDPVRPKVVITIIVGVIGGLMVGLTSVGSGSLIIIALMAIYPTLSANRLVGTDLVQAVPLVAAAAFGHILFGDVDWSIAIPISLGSIPGVILGAHFSARVAGGVVRRILAVVLLAAGLKLIGLSNELTLIMFIVAPILGTLGWMAARKSRGLAPTARQELSRRDSDF